MFSKILSDAAQLKTHLDTIAQLLYEKSDLENMQTLKEIEMTLCYQIQASLIPANLISKSIIHITLNQSSNVFIQLFPK